MTGPDGRPGDGFMLGVDLGTSHTVAMLRWPDGRTRPLLFDGQPLLPSAVYLDTTGRVHVGRDALRLGHADPARFEPNPKRHIDADTVLLGGAEMPVAELFAGLLSAVAQEAVAAVGFLPPAVVTYPAAWGERRRAVLTDALARAGWPAETRFVPEPVAAARYFADVLRRPVPVGSALAVFDFGGGTLDVAVVRNAGPAPDGHPRFEVAASGGAGDLGGLDVDAALVDHLGKELAGAEPEAWRTVTDPATLAQWRARRQFWDDVRGAKEMLSRSALAPVPVPGVEHAVHLTRDELEAAAGPLIRRGVDEAAQVIKAAGLTPPELAGLFLVGGSSRVPMVSRLLHSELGIAPTVLEQPELPVSEGAIRAGTPGPDVRPQTDTAPAVSTPKEPEPTAPGTVDADYAEPVDPWATGEAAAFAAAGGYPPLPSSGAPAPGPATPGHEPWLASTQPESPSDNAPGGPPKTAGGRLAPYRKRWVWVVAAATVVVVGVGATLAVIFWPGYRSLDYQQLSEPRAIAPAVPLSSGFSDSAVLGDRAYFAAETDDGLLNVVAAEAGTGKRLWASDQAGRAERWDRMIALPAGLAVLTDSDLSTSKRRLVLLGAPDGGLLWQRTIDRDDTVFFVGDIAVLVDRAEDRLLGLEINGKGAVRWEEPNVKTSSGTGAMNVFPATTDESLSGPADVTGVPFGPDADDEDRIVQISSDRSVHMLDAGTGDVVGEPRAGVVGPGEPAFMHNGRLIVREPGSPQKILAYDLTGTDEPKVLYTAADDNVQLTELTPCGEDWVCWLEETGYDAATAGIAGVGITSDTSRWLKKVADAEAIVPVGGSVLVTGSTTESVSLVGVGQDITWTRDGAAARLDGGNLLTFSNKLSTTPDDPALAAQHLGDEMRELGPMRDVRSQTCSWNTSVIACVRDKDFMIQRFAK